MQHLDTFFCCCVHQAELYHGRLPTSVSSGDMLGDKLHQTCQKTVNSAKQVLAGFAWPDPYFNGKVKTTVERLMKCLRDPALPLYELQVLLIIAVLSQLIL